MASEMAALDLPRALEAILMVVDEPQSVVGLASAVERPVKEVRAAKVQGSGIMERIAFLEMKKKTFNELQAELSKRKEEIDSAADAEFKVKQAEVEARP